MRRRRPSKQRLWLGSGRYLCCGGRLPDADTHGYSDCDRHANGNSISISNDHTPANANTQVGTVAKAASHTSAQALVYSGKISDVARR
jgi:hypothetical protein